MMGARDGSVHRLASFMLRGSVITHDLQGFASVRRMENPASQER